MQALLNGKMFFANLQEIQDIYNHGNTLSINDLWLVLQNIAKQGFDTIFVTDIKNGVYVLHRERKIHYPAYSVDKIINIFNIENEFSATVLNRFALQQNITVHDKKLAA